MLTARVVRPQVPIPHEPNEWLSLRMLSGTMLEEASDARQREIMGVARDLGAELWQALQNVDRPASNGSANGAEPDPLAGYNLQVLLEKGITAWSYDAELTPENIGDLDKDTREWAGKTILAIGKETEDDRKNALRASTASSTAKAR